MAGNRGIHYEDLLEQQNAERLAALTKLAKLKQIISRTCNARQKKFARHPACPVSGSGQARCLLHKILR